MMECVLTKFMISGHKLKSLLKDNFDALIKYFIYTKISMSEMKSDFTRSMSTNSHLKRALFRKGNFSKHTDFVQITREL